MAALFKQTSVREYRSRGSAFPRLTSAPARDISPHRSHGCAAAEAAKSEGIVFCSRCGIQVEEGHRFCRACGQEVGAAVTSVPAPAGAIPASNPVSAPTSALPYAGFWVRFAAYLIDGLILSIPFGFLAIVLIFLFGGFGMMLRRNPIDAHEAAFLAGPVILFFLMGILFLMALSWLYHAGMESSARQATFGKASMSLRVTNLEGQRISFGHATGRFFAKIVSGMIPFGIGFIMAGFTERKQALHDLIAGTLVLRK
jgi:uncharacterized RDD family membrane protein YckC